MCLALIPGDPSNTRGPKEDCVVFGDEALGRRWKDLPCSTFNHALCQNKGELKKERKKERKKDSVILTPR